MDLWKGGCLVQKIQAVKGTRDVLPEESPTWRVVERAFQDICERFAYEEIRTPTFEYTEVFQRGVGDTTDIVQKEMYTFEDRGGRSLTLRPEATAEWSAHSRNMAWVLYLFPFAFLWDFLLPC